MDTIMREFEAFLDELKENDHETNADCNETVLTVALSTDVC